MPPQTVKKNNNKYFVTLFDDFNSENEMQTFSIVICKCHSCYDHLLFLSKCEYIYNSQPLFLYSHCEVQTAASYCLTPHIFIFTQTHRGIADRPDNKFICAYHFVNYISKAINSSTISNFMKIFPKPVYKHDDIAVGVTAGKCG